MLGVTGVAFTALLGIAVPEVLPGDRGTDPRPRVGKVADGVWDQSCLTMRASRWARSVPMADADKATTRRGHEPCRVMASPSRLVRDRPAARAAASSVGRFR